MLPHVVYMNTAVWMGVQVSVYVEAKDSLGVFYSSSLSALLF